MTTCTAQMTVPRSRTTLLRSWGLDPARVQSTWRICWVRGVSQSVAFWTAAGR